MASTRSAVRVHARVQLSKSPSTIWAAVAKHSPTSARRDAVLPSMRRNWNANCGSSNLTFTALLPRLPRRCRSSPPTRPLPPPVSRILAPCKRPLDDLREAPLAGGVLHRGREPAKNVVLSPDRHPPERVECVHVAQGMRQ